MNDLSSRCRPTPFFRKTKVLPNNVDRYVLKVIMFFKCYKELKINTKLSFHKYFLFVYRYACLHARALFTDSILATSKLALL